MGFAGTVYFEFGRSKDMNLDIKVMRYNLNIDNFAQVEYIIAMAVSFYNKKLIYSPIPIQRNTYNSNSFTSGLLDVSGISKPDIPYNLPGWNKPIPIKFYGAGG